MHMNIIWSRIEWMENPRRCASSLTPSGDSSNDKVDDTDDDELEEVEGHAG